MELIPSLLETTVSLALVIELIGVGLLIFRMLRWPRGRSAGTQSPPGRRERPANPRSF